MATKTSKALAKPPIEAVSARLDTDPSVRVLRQFRLIFNAVKTHFQQVEKSAGIGGIQVWALSVIRDRPGIGVTDLARALDVRQPTASNVVRQLLEQQMLSARKDAPDKRSVQLYLLPAGSRVLRRVPGPFTGVLPHALAEIHPAMLERMEQDLGALIQALKADSQAARIPLSQM